MQRAKGVTFKDLHANWTEKAWDHSGSVAAGAEDEWWGYHDRVKRTNCFSK